MTFAQSGGELIDHGDSLSFTLERTLADDPREIEVSWVYADRSPEEEAEGWQYLYRQIT